MPRSRCSAFLVLSAVLSCTGTSGVLIDNRDDSGPTSPTKDSYVVSYGPELDLRRPRDGSQYRVVEIFYEPKELQSLLGDKGWDARFDATPWFISERLGLRRDKPSTIKCCRQAS